MRVEQIGNATLYLGDCMEALAEMKENQFDLAIVDPPYGIGLDKNVCGRLSRYGSVSKADNNPPTAEYFKELERASTNRIIWGANYFNMLPTRCFLIWDKQQPVGVSFADSEYAWTSFNESAKTFRKRPQNADKDGRIHPTQKPVALYSWLLKNYAKAGDSLLDTHMGSGSSVIAALDAGHPITAYELDEEYFDAACRRIEEAQRQQKLFP